MSAETDTCAVDPTADITLGPASPRISEITVGGEVLEIIPRGLIEISAMAKQIEPALRRLKTVEENTPITDIALDLLLDEDLCRGAMQFAAIGCGRPLSWVVDELQADEQLALFIKVLEVHLDFFARRLWPAAAAGWAMATTNLSAGPT